jgi:hypothetical protein
MSAVWPLSFILFLPKKIYAMLIVKAFPSGFQGILKREPMLESTPSGIACQFLNSKPGISSMFKVRVSLESKVEANRNQCRD